MRRSISLFALIATLAACGTERHDPAANEPSAPPEVRDADEASGPNLALWTLGGRQVWADIAWRQGWRIQENVVTGHFRLLDGEDIRRAWGSEEDCRAELTRVVRELDLTPRSDRLVVLLHGLFRSRHSFDAMEQALVAAGYDVAGLGYPSTQESVEETATRVARLLGELEGYDEVSFVTHSLGGLVARALLAREVPWPGAMRVGRLVMLGPPNQGAAFVESLEDLAVYDWVTGPAGSQVIASNARELPIPRVTFGIIAGGRGDDQGYNPLLEGDDDGVVRVAETRLEGAADWLVVRGMHSFLMQEDEVVQATLHFLEHGRFDTR